MSIQFGVLNLNEEPVEPNLLAEARASIARYPRDRITIYVEKNVGLLYSEFCSKDTGPEIQPHVSTSGAICLWDGRLDNASELTHQVGQGLNAKSSEPDIIAACYRQHGLDILPDLLGDWALAIWDPLSQCLVLAKDFLGTRHLYYRVEGDQVIWSTVLDPLVSSANGSLSLNAEYVAGCLSHLPAAHLTPYSGIHAVPPASYILFKRNRRESKEYWRFCSARTVRYGKDSEYEEHFRHSFGESVRRRLRSSTPVLAELSGGMDSSSIVCMADHLISIGRAQPPHLDTISYYSTSEPDWDEQPFFSRVEEHRGRTGFHVDLGPCGFFQFGCSGHDLALVPDAVRLSEADRAIGRYVESAGHRVMLSGIGGDEVTGGVPTPLPELSDLLATRRVSSLAHQLKLWALNQRRPWLHLLAEICRDFLPATIAAAPAYARPATWICSNFVRRHRAAMLGYPKRLKLFGSLPSFQQRLNTLEALRRRIAWSALAPGFPCERRYPYLDRDLLEFLFAVSPEQLVRPGQRRSLMRRALRDIVPAQVLNRKRKAFVSRAPRLAIRDQWDEFANGELLCASLGVVDSARLLDAMKQVQSGKDIPLVPLVRTLSLEGWLRQLADRRVCHNIATADHANALLSWDHLMTERR